MLVRVQAVPESEDQSNVEMGDHVEIQVNEQHGGLTIVFIDQTQLASKCKVMICTTKEDFLRALGDLQRNTNIKIIQAGYARIEGCDPWSFKVDKGNVPLTDVFIPVPHEGEQTSEKTE